MRTFKFALTFCATLFFTTGVIAQSEENKQKEKTTETKTIETQVLELINNHRLSIGLSALAAMPLVKSVAFSHTDYMVYNNEVSHENFYKRSDYLKANAGATRVTENVAYGYSSAQSVVNAWLKSDAHRANIEGDFTNFDIAAEENSDGKWYYTNIFIKK